MQCNKFIVNLKYQKQKYIMQQNAPIQCYIIISFYWIIITREKETEALRTPSAGQLWYL